MSGVSRHKACKMCRDRKVKCDGGQPQCEKCRRLGAECIYSPTYKPTKADLAQTIESLRDRMQTTEAYMARQNTSIQSNSNQQAPGQDLAMNVESFDLPQWNMHMQLPNLTSPTDPFSPSNHIGSQQPNRLPFSNNIGGDFLNNFPLNSCEESLGGQVEGSDDGFMHVPSLQEVRALNSTSSSSSLSLFPTNKSDQLEHAEKLGRILSEFQAFSSSIFRTQVEIAAISSAVAEYLAWVRKAPGMPRSPNSAAVLETLEVRIRELHDMAENRHWAAWGQMIEKLDGMETQLCVFTSEMQRLTAERMQHLHTSYDVGKAMQEQVLGLQLHE